MAAAFGALRDDGVGSGFGCPYGLSDSGDHVQHLCLRFVSLGEPLGERLIGLGPSGRDDRRLSSQRSGPLGFTGAKQQKVEAEGPVCPGSDCGGQLRDLFGSATATTLDTEPTGVGNRGDQIRVGPQTHPAEHHGMGDPQKLADGSPQHVDGVTSSSDTECCADRKWLRTATSRSPRDWPSRGRGSGDGSTGLRHAGDAIQQVREPIRQRHERGMIRVERDDLSSPR